MRGMMSARMVLLGAMWTIASWAQSRFAKRESQSRGSSRRCVSMRSFRSRSVETSQGENQSRYDGSLRTSKTRRIQSTEVGLWPHMFNVVQIQVCTIQLYRSMLFHC